MNDISSEKSDQATIYNDIKPKLEILDAVFHPRSSDNLIALGLINGKLKLYRNVFPEFIVLIYLGSYFPFTSYKVSNERKRLVSVQKLHKKSIRKISFTQDDQNYMFTASKDKTIKLTDLNESKTIMTIENAHKKPINCLTTIDNWLLASADDNGCVKV
jgi:WD40 repeat protein